MILLFPAAAVLADFLWRYDPELPAIYENFRKDFKQVVGLLSIFGVLPHFLHTFAVDALVTAFGQPSRRRALVALAINMAVVLTILSLFALGSEKALIPASLYGLALGFGQYLRWRYVCWLLDRGSADNLPVIYRVVEWMYLLFAAFVIFVFGFMMLELLMKRQ